MANWILNHFCMTIITPLSVAVNFTYLGWVFSEFDCDSHRTSCTPWNGWRNTGRIHPGRTALSEITTQLYSYIKIHTLQQYQPFTPSTYTLPVLTRQYYISSTVNQALTYTFNICVTVDSISTWEFNFAIQPFCIDNCECQIFIIVSFN